jgi:restriction system protein
MLTEISLITLGVITIFTITKKNNEDKKKKLIQYTGMTNEKAKKQFDAIIKGTYQNPKKATVQASSNNIENLNYYEIIEKYRTKTPKQKMIENSLPSKKEFKPYSAEEKREYAIRQRENKKKGDDYEKFVGEYFKKQGYIIAQNGLDNGKKDHGIDIIAKKEKEIIFIQCRNWKVSKKYPIKHNHLKEFLGNCSTYVEKNPIYTTYKIKRYYAISNEIMDKSAETFISQNYTIIQKLLLRMPE